MTRSTVLLAVALLAGGSYSVALKAHLLTREDPGTVELFSQQNPYSFPILLDPGGQVSKLYGVEAIPTTVRPVVDIGRNTFGAVIRNKVLYLPLFLLVLIIALMMAPLAMIGMLAESNEQEMARQLQVNLIVGVFGLWTNAAMVMAMFLGATAIRSEVRARTIVTVLSKPVERWRFLLGKWLGTEATLVLFLTIGVLLSIGIFSAFGVRPGGLFWIGVFRTYVIMTIIAGFAMLLSTVSSAVVAGGATLFLTIMVGIAAQAVEAPYGWLRLPARAFWFLAPARPPVDLLAQGFALDVLDPPYGLYVGVLAENVLYAAALVVLACIVFSRRELALQ